MPYFDFDVEEYDWLLEYNNKFKLHKKQLKNRIYELEFKLAA